MIDVLLVIQRYGEIQVLIDEYDGIDQGDQPADNETSLCGNIVHYNN